MRLHRLVARLLTCVLCCSPWSSGCSSYDWKHRVLYTKDGTILYAEFQERDGDQVPQGFLHPVHLPSETVEEVLARLAYRNVPLVGKNTNLRLFDQRQVANLSGPVRDALAILTPNERLRFLVMPDRWASSITGPKATSGVLFVREEGVLNLAVDLIRAGVDVPPGGNPEDISFAHEPTEFREADHLIPFPGSRLHVETLDSGTRRFPRWLEIELAEVQPPPPRATEAARTTPAASVSEGGTTEEASTPAATAGAGTTAETEEERYSRLKEKLETLKRLKAEGIVTEEEYEQQFDRIMNEL